MERMAGRNAEEVSKAEFLEYLCSLQNIVAVDRTMSDVSSEGSDDDDTDNEYDLELCPCHIFRRSLSGNQLAASNGLCRDLPGFLRQMRIVCIRRLIQWWRSNRQRGIFLGVIMFAAVVLAIMDDLLCDEPDWAPDP